MSANEFTPKQIDNLELWLKADAGVDIWLDNETPKVTLWKDQSGNARDFKANEAFGPKRTGFPIFDKNSLFFITNFTYRKGFYPSALFLPSDKLNFTGAYTLIAVVEDGPNLSLSMPSVNTVFSKSTNCVAKRRKFQLSIKDGAIWSQESIGDEEPFVCRTDISNKKRLIVVAYHAPTYLMSGHRSLAIIRHNGFEVASKLSYWGLELKNDAPVFIGASPFYPWTGYVTESSHGMRCYEIIMYSRAISLKEIEDLELYLNNKYKVYI